MKTYRDIFKWGDKREEPLEKNIHILLSEIFGFSENRFVEEFPDGNKEVNLKFPGRIAPEIIHEIEKISGAANCHQSDFERAFHAYGKYYVELLKLRHGLVEFPPDLVVYPRNNHEVQQIVALCNSHKIPVIPFGGGSSVTGALQAPKGGICLDLSKNMNKIIGINEINQSVCVEAGIMGPELEKALNSYKSGYTCGHFPQSFEYSTPGGWIAARGAGTFSTGYGKMEEMVLSLKVVCPSGIIETKDYPSSAEGIDINRIFAGSEGIFGIITEATLKVRKYQPKNTAYASFIFKSFDSAVEAMRNTMQAGSGKPHLFRISDPAETEIAFRLKNFNNSFSDRLLQMLGYKPGQRTLMFAAIEGNREYTSLVKKLLKKMARKSGGFYIGNSPVKKWLEQRYSSAYARDPLMDKGIITDTIETAVSWQNLLPLWKAIVKYLDSRPKTISMIHISHVYENGANLYITFLSPVNKRNDFEDYLGLHKGLVDTIVNNKGSLSHHHGIGRVLAPWMHHQYGSNSVSVLRAIKNELDPNGIMNPGGMLGLD